MRDSSDSLDRIIVQLGFLRQNSSTSQTKQSFSHSFEMTDDDTYGVVLDHVQKMLESLGFEFGNKMLMAVEPGTIVTDIDPSSGFTDSNVIGFKPKDPQ